MRILGSFIVGDLAILGHKYELTLSLSILQCLVLEDPGLLTVIL